MRILLDTHALLWALAGDSRLGAGAAAAFLDESNELRVSVASLWEIAVKASLGKLELDRPVDDLLGELRRQGILVQAIEVDHVLAVRTLPFHHRDPFERLLAAQALAEGLALMSRDREFDRYGVTRVW